MNKEELLSKVLNKKVQDYSFLIFFFLIFAIFVFFAIRPNLITAFSLQRELEDLRFQDQQYERVITNIVSYQGILEETREDFYLFEEAIPLHPEIFVMVNDIRETASNSGVPLSRLEVSEVTLKGETQEEIDAAAANKRNTQQTTTQKEKTRKYVVEFDAVANFTEVKNIVSSVNNQRRIKVIDNITIQSNGAESTQSATYRVSFEVNGFYL